MPVTLGDAINAINNGQFYGDMGDPQGDELNDWKKLIISTLNNHIKGGNDTQVTAETFEDIVTKIRSARKKAIADINQIKKEHPAVEEHKSLDTVPQNLVSYWKNYANYSNQVHELEAIELQCLKMAEDIRPNGAGESDGKFDGVAWVKNDENDTYQQCTIGPSAYWEQSTTEPLWFDPKLALTCKSGK